MKAPDDIAVIIELMLNEKFKKWVMQSEKDDEVYWEAWLKQHSHQSGNVLRAKELLQSFAKLFEVKWEISSEEREELWAQIIANLKDKED